MKQYMSKKVGVPVEHLFVAEEFKSKFYKIYDDGIVASEEIGSQDNVAVYELEAKPQIGHRLKVKTKKNYTHSNRDSEDDTLSWDDPLSEKMLVPVFYRRPNPERSSRYNKKAWNIVPAPHFIIVTPEEVRHEISSYC